MAATNAPWSPFEEYAAHLAFAQMMGLTHHYAGRGKAEDWAY